MASGTDKRGEEGHSEDQSNPVVRHHGVAYLASITWEELVKIVNRSLSHDRQVPLDIKDFSDEKEAAEAIKKTARWKEWQKGGRDFMITRWIPRDPAQTLVVIGSAAIIATSLGMLLNSRKKWNKNKRVLPPKEKK